MRLLGGFLPWWILPALALWAVFSLGGFSLLGVVSPCLGFLLWVWFARCRSSCFRCFARSEYCLIILSSFRRLFVWVVCLFSACGVACCPSWVSVLAFPVLPLLLIFVRFVCRGSMALYFARFRLFLLSSVKYKGLPVFALFRLCMRSEWLRLSMLSGLRSVCGFQGSILSF